ncbi:MAG: tetratricopeptide repeat protein [Verrucomicrobiota bacterium]
MSNEIQHDHEQEGGRQTSVEPFISTISAAKDKKAIPYTITLPLLGSVILFISLLIPSQEEIIERMLMDEEFDRLKEVIASIPEQTRPSNSLIFTIAELRIDRRDAQSTNDSKHLADSSSKKLLERNLRAYQQFEYPEDFAIELGQTLGATPSLKICSNYFPNISQTLSKQDFAIFSENLKEQSQALGNPVPRIFLKRHQIEEGDRSTKNLKELIGLWRSQNKPEEALADINTFLDRVRPYEEHLAELGSIYHEKLKLLREVNLSGQAFELLAKHRDHFEHQLGIKETFDLLEIVGLQAGRAKELLPIYLAWTQRFPKDQATLRKYAELSLALGEEEQALYVYQRLVQFDSSNPVHRLQLAQILEWNDQPSKAFHHYRILALQGNELALDRMIALNPGLFRDMDLIEAIEYQLGKSQLKNSEQRQPQLTLTLANLLVQQGAYQKAQARYLEYLNSSALISNTDRTHVLVQIAALETEMNHFPEAIAIYHKVLGDNPDHHLATFRLAQMEVLLGDYENATARLRLLSEKTKHSEVIKQYLTISKSLGYIDDIIRANELLLAVSSADELDAENYQTLAYYYQLSDQSDAALHTINLAQQKYPNDHELKLNLAQMFYDQGEFEQSLATLEPTLSENPSTKAQILYLYLLLATEQDSKAYSYIKESDPTFLEQQELAPTLAYIYLRAGNLQKARELYLILYEKDPTKIEIAESLAYIYDKMYDRQAAVDLIKSFDFGNNPRFLRLAAQLYSKLNFHKKALLHMEQYCRVESKLDSDSWRLLAELLEQSGNSQKAKQAYERALSETVKDLKKSDSLTDHHNRLNPKSMI